MFTVSATGLVVRLAPPSIRGRISSLNASAFLFGNIAGPLVGGLLAGLGLRVPFLVYAVSLLLAVLVVAVLLPARTGAPRSGDDGVPLLSLREALGDSAYRAALTSGFAHGWTSFGMRIALVPLFVVFVLGAEPWVAGTALAVFAGGNAVALGFAGRLADTLGRRPMVLTGLLLSGGATATIGLTTSVPALYATALLAGAGAGCLGPAQQATLADVIGPGRNGGAVIPPFQMATDFGTIGAPIVAGLLADRVGYAWAFATAGVVAVVALMAWARARETLPRPISAGQSPPNGTSTSA